MGLFLCLARFWDTQPPYGDGSTTDIMFAFMLCASVGGNIAWSYNVIKKFAWGGDKDDDDDEKGIDGKSYYYVVLFHSTGFSAIACCCSLIVSGILLYKLNGVASELAGNYKKVALHTIISWTFKTCPYSIGITAFIAMALLFGFRTCILITRKLKVLVSGCSKSGAANLPVLNSGKDSVMLDLTS
ncbi:putative Transporter [Corchorus olitorius]|uniref:Transporter n=1 Tax=Corchorus olitorius TaxID=93759 RepID=A0A1R3IPV0_9ROSI|nr:putative Transporter [Corchorus olitorius]